MQKFHADDISLPTSDWLCRFNQVSLITLGSDVSSVWNFCTCFLDVISQGNQCFFSKVKLAVLGAYLTVMGESPFLGGKAGGCQWIFSSAK